MHRKGINMKNNKGFTVVELLASFTLTMIIVVFLFEIVLELKNIYINESIKTESINKNAVVATAIHKLLDEPNLSNVSCSGSTCTITPSNKKIIIGNKTVTVGNQKFTYPEKTELQNLDIDIIPYVATTANHNIVKIRYDVVSGDLDKPIKFNYIYTYTS